MFGTYILHNEETDETYAGSGILRKRERTHFRTLKNNTHHNHRLQEAYNRNPNFEFISVPTETQEEAREFEQILIDEYSAHPLFLNLALKVGSKVSILTPEVKNKISEKIRAHYASGKLVSPMVGKTHTEETKQKYSQDRMGNQFALGSKHTEEWKQERSKAMQGNQHLLGHRHSEETRERMSAAHKGVPKSPEAIKKAAEGRTRHNVVIDGVTYFNAAIAAEALGLSRSGVDKRCASDNFPNYQKVEKERTQ